MGLIDLLGPTLSSSGKKSVLMTVKLFYSVEPNNWRRKT